MVCVRVCVCVCDLPLVVCVTFVGNNHNRKLKQFLPFVILNSAFAPVWKCVCMSELNFLKHEKKRKK